MASILSAIKQLFPIWFKDWAKGLINTNKSTTAIAYSDNNNTYYSQEGEDILLSRFLDDKTANGFYVDIGAHHPTRFSNTYFFYQRGWRGINVDAMPGSMKVFNETRPRDINIETPVSDTEDTLTYYVFNEPALNSLSPEKVETLKNHPHYFVKETIPLKTQTLATILDKYLPEGQKIDFLSIDVEGVDFKVLKSNNWARYRPSFVLVEDTVHGLENFKQSEVYQFMHSHNYTLVARTLNTMFFKTNQPE